MTARTTGRPDAPASSNGSRSRPSPNGTSLATAKRSTPMAVVGLVAVVLGALLFLALYTSVDKRQSVLGVARPVAAGQVITTADLRVVRVSSATGITPLPASRQSSVVGKTAGVGLVPGSLLVESQLGSSSDLHPGQAVVALALKAGQAPPSLRAGTRVQVVESVKSSGGDQAKPVVLSTQAIVSSTGKADSSSNSTTVVSLIVPAADAPAVTASAPDGRVSLIVLPGQP
ncbi:MAG: SAF domain-containing protein [Actinomycetota bacterium]|nr:SAF domain-containing protein [Actinomycetota bacterium]